jgi:hypothetical protein
MNEQAVCVLVGWIATGKDVRPGDMLPVGWEKDGGPPLRQAFVEVTPYMILQAKRIRWKLVQAAARHGMDPATGYTTPKRSHALNKPQ